MVAQDRWLFNAVPCGQTHPGWQTANEISGHSTEGPLHTLHRCGHLGGQSFGWNGAEHLKPSAAIKTKNYLNG